MCVCVVCVCVCLCVCLCVTLATAQDVFNSDSRVSRSYDCALAMPLEKCFIFKEIDARLLRVSTVNINSDYNF